MASFNSRGQPSCLKRCTCHEDLKLRSFDSSIVHKVLFPGQRDSQDSEENCFNEDHGFDWGGGLFAILERFQRGYTLSAGLRVRVRLFSLLEKIRIMRR